MVLLREMCRCMMAIAKYTRKLMNDFDWHGRATRLALTSEEADMWRSRMYNAARRMDFIVTTHWTGRELIGTLKDWK